MDDGIRVCKKYTFHTTIRVSECNMKTNTLKLCIQWDKQACRNKQNDKVEC